jgi:hypothetical protein
MKCFFLFFIFFYFIHGAPIPGDSLDAPISAVENDFSASLTIVDSEEENDNCYFEKERKSPYEENPRPAVSRIQTECGGNLQKYDALILRFFSRMGDIMKDNEAEYGSLNEIDKILVRGAGEFTNDWDDEQTKKRILNRKICDNHLQELSRDWSSTRYYHIMRRWNDKKDVCSVPDGIGFAHDGNHRPIIQNKNALNRDEAFAVLQKFKTLLHIGLRKNYFII